MSTPELSSKKKLPIRSLVVAAAIAFASAAIAIGLVGLSTVVATATLLFNSGMKLVSGAGPIVYFACLAILPLFGMPTSPFAIGAVPLFGKTLGTPLIVVLAIVAITIDLTLAYWLARRWFHPFLYRRLKAFGYAIPQANEKNATDLIILLRVTPGIPFWVQNYLLGLASVPFGRYMAISCAAQWLLNFAFILFGDALSKGRGKTALFAIMLFAAFVSVANILRKRLPARKAADQGAPNRSRD